MILIADDNENDAMELAECIRKAGAKNPLTVVSDGKEVIAYFRGEEKYADRTEYPLPSILLLDIKMPGLDGFEVMERLSSKKYAEGVLIVVLTGYELANIRRGYELGARSFLPKPCRVDDIQNLMRTYSTYWESDKPISGGSKDTDRLAPLSL